MTALAQFYTSATFTVVNSSNRLELATTIERLINMLDDLDGDPDLEDGADAEPALGGWLAGGVVDRITGKVQDDLEADDGESGIGDKDGLGEQTGSALGGEGDLGWTTDINQTVAMQPSSLPWSVDDGEPSLGWTEYGRGTTDDREPDLGWTGDGRGAIKGEVTDDREMTTAPMDDREDDMSDNEPSLGWRNHGSQGMVGMEGWSGVDDEQCG